jgi:hypothetical protein
VKCAKCDRRYSAVRARCPYCGARRGSRGKLSGGTDSTKTQLVIGIIFLLALIAAVTALLLTSAETEIDYTPPPVSGDVTPHIPDSNTNNTIDDPDETPPEETPTPPEDTPPPAIESVAITYNGRATTDFTESVGRSLTLKAKIVPDGLDIVPEWESSNPEVFDVVPTDTTGLTVSVTMIKAGNAKLKVTAGDKTAECIVRVK